MARTVAPRRRNEQLHESHCRSGARGRGRPDAPPRKLAGSFGKRVLDDPRNQLFREYVRLLRGLQPRVFVMENVSGMVKGKMKLVFADALRELKAGGYVVSARLLNAKYFNVPQSRERLIFIGVREDIARGRATAGDEAEGED